MAAPSGLYNVIRPRTATTTAITVVQVKCVADAAVEVTRAWGGQSSSTTSAATALALLRKTAAATVTSQTPAVIPAGAQASKCVGGTSATGITATVEGTDGAILWEEGFNLVGNGVLYLPVPEERIMVVGATNGIFGLKHTVAPAGNWTHGVEWLEYAG